MAYCLYCGSICRETIGGACRQCAYDRRVAPGSRIYVKDARGRYLETGGPLLKDGGPDEKDGDPIEEPGTKPQDEERVQEKGREGSAPRKAE